MSALSLHYIPTLTYSVPPRGFLGFIYSSRPFYVCTKGAQNRGAQTRRSIPEQPLSSTAKKTTRDRSALDSPFRTRRAPNLATRGPQPTADRRSSGSSLSGPSLTTPSPPAAAATASAAAAAAAASLPWQGARVCIVELAPSLTFLGAVRAVEAEARRVGRENGLTLREQNLLICADLQ